MEQNCLKMVETLERETIPLALIQTWCTNVKHLFSAIKGASVVDFSTECTVMQHPRSRSHCVDLKRAQTVGARAVCEDRDRTPGRVCEDRDRTPGRV